MNSTFLRTTSFLGIVALGLAVFHSGCGKRKAQNAEPLPERMSRLAAAGDTAALGELALDQCRDRAGREKKECYENYFVELSDSGRVAVALGALSVLAGKDHQVKADGHVYTHLIGIKAWKPGRDIAGVFASCNGLFQSGCYHGVIQAVFTSDGSVDSAEVARLCDQVEGSTRNLWLRFQCVHGIGHGLEMIWNWDLLRALRGCDWLITNWDRQSCYGGAFMENAVASMPGGHHAPARVLAQRSDTAAESGEHEGHGGHGEHGLDPGAVGFKMRDSSNPHYPCNVVDSKYASACYMLQGGLILEYHDYDFARAAADCDTAAPDVRHLCYLSMGTMASGMTVQNTRQVIRLCANGNPTYRTWCFVGAVKNYIDVTADFQDGVKFCRAIPPGRDKRQCYVAVGEQISVMHAEPARREAACATVHPEGRLECRFGAGLLTTPPPGLPIRPGVS